MAKNATIITIILSLLVVSASIWVGGLLIKHPEQESLIASSPVAPPALPADEGDSTTISIDDDLSPPTEPEPTPEPVIPKIEPPVVTRVDRVVPVSSGQGGVAGTNFWVQAGSFSSLARANSASQALQQLGLAGNIETTNHNGKVLYRLRFGAWQSKAEAERFRDYLTDQKNLRKAFLERQLSDTSSDFIDAYVVQAR
jgi:cell division protein FtsN